MPKEVIYSSELFNGDEPENVGILEVRWSRESEYCQVASVLVEASTHMPIERSVSGGWYINLDRRKLNDLIRYLRRARDQAFGRDE